MGFEETFDNSYERVKAVDIDGKGFFDALIYYARTLVDETESMNSNNARCSEKGGR